MVAQGKSYLQRPVHPMPGSIRDALVENGLAQANDARPPYQKNDYFGGIARAKLDELKSGGRYMKMTCLWRGDRAWTKKSS
jgi:hypothetical protein